MNIAITFRDDQPLHQSWFGSGIAQNLKFYYDLFELMGHSVCFLTNKDIQIDISEKVYRVVTRQALIDQAIKTDVIIEAGVVISQAEKDLYRQTCGARVIGLRCGNQYLTAAEGLLTKKDLPRHLFSSGHDALWILPHHGEQAEWLSVLHSCPVTVVRYIWEPDFVPQLEWPEWSSNKPDIVVMEPNISVAKNMFVPIAALQKLYLDEPESFARAYIYNGGEFSNAGAFLYNFVNKLTVLQAHNEKAYFEPRRPFADVFDRPRVLLGHQFHNELNNLYKEAIYLGVPLVHNSPPYQAMGYYYPAMQASVAAEQIKCALRSHNPKEAARAGKIFLFDYSIHNPEIQAHYERMLHNLV